MTTIMYTLTSNYTHIFFQDTKVIITQQPYYANLASVHYPLKQMHQFCLSQHMCESSVRTLYDLLMFLPN